MKNLHELIEEQGKSFRAALKGYMDAEAIETGGEVGEQDILDKGEELLARALKEIALQSIEACEVAESKLDENTYPPEDDKWEATYAESDGWNAAREEAKQRAGVFLGEV